MRWRAASATIRSRCIEFTTVGSVNSPILGCCETASTARSISAALPTLEFVISTPTDRATALTAESASVPWTDSRMSTSTRSRFVPADRDIFAIAKGVIAETIASLVVVLRSLVVVEDPTGVLGAARLVHQAADLVVLVVPEPAHAAVLTILVPQLRIYAPIGAERGDELVAVLGGTVGEFLRAREIEPNALEHVRQLGHDGPPLGLAGA